MVVASTDYSMHQAEEFTLVSCPTCTSNQVKVQGKTTSDLKSALNLPMLGMVLISFSPFTLVLKEPKKLS